MKQNVRHVVDVSARKGEGTVQVGFRLPPELVDQIDQLADQMSAAAHGLPVSRTDAAYVALKAGLEQLLEKKPKSRKDG